MKSTTENSAVRLFLTGVGRVAPRLDGAMRTIKHQAISGVEREFFCVRDGN
jgi:hypothetical protein